MNQALESLLEVVEQDPLPERHTSSHWKDYGSQIVVKRRGERLMLKGAGFTAHSNPNRLCRALYSVERLSYWPVVRTLKSFPSIFRKAKSLARELRVSMSRHEWSSALVLSVLWDHFQEHRLQPRTFALIGDGDGFLGALILRCFEGSAVRLYNMDLPKVLVFQAETHIKAAPGISLSVLLPGQDNPLAKVMLVHPDCIERISEGIDCAVNLVSMQEMKPSSVQAYFDFLRRRSGSSSRFYCVNRLRNELPGGEISSFMDYPWSGKDEVFLDIPCRYFRHFMDPSTYPSGPRLLGLRVPMINYFSGLSWERLVRLAETP